ncbi:uncharacterized protein LOC115623642 [Scaptodrosophila lebanonensis]|uniref:Uncharacterized protein LOC115623642 n=1 Tax=Drosophila lebanonensis TaxID=7225 RepID=A0A6J2TG16_DROLE|nr:uncharacterized protein LOC115623642 [Scaptodrosophila lebanonensis]
MPESDVTKMKVADLKRELKLRGLPMHGNKNELQERLQTALLEGDISLEDSAITALEDDDVLLTDEDEHKLLEDDHDDLLLKSPVSTPTTVSESLLPTTAKDGSSIAVTSAAESSTTAETPITSTGGSSAQPAKKIVLKRNNSQPLSEAGGTAASTTPSVAKENAAPASESKLIRKPIVAGASVAKDTDSTNSSEKKLTELTAQERLELRAKKFGITSGATAASTNVNKSSSASIVANKGNKETEEQQREALKRRAERFGCVVPDKTPKTAVDERLQKRKERFGVVISTDSKTGTSTNSAGSIYAEKARARLERFKATVEAMPTK